MADTGAKWTCSVYIKLQLNAVACVMGDPHPYLLSADQLAAFAERLAQPVQIPPPPC